MLVPFPAPSARLPTAHVATQRSQHQHSEDKTTNKNNKAKITTALFFKKNISLGLMFCVREVCWFARMHLLQLQDCQHSSDISLFTLHLPKTKKNTSRNTGQTIAKSSILYPECRNHKIWNQSLCIFVKPFTSVRNPRSHIAIWLHIFFGLSLYPRERGGAEQKTKKGQRPQGNLKEIDVVSVFGVVGAQSEGNGS